MVSSRSGFFTLCTWNTLAKSLCDDDSFPYVDHVNSLDWSHRQALIEKTLTEMNADIVCLQEVDQDIYDEFILEFSRKNGYLPSFNKKPHNKDGCCLLVKSKVFHVKSVLHFHYGEFTKEKTPNQVAIIAKLIHKATQKPLCVSTTHLKAKEGFEEMRAFEMDALLKETAYEAWPTRIIAGDLNDVVTSPVCDLLRKAQMKSAYPSGVWTTFKKRATGEVCREIDYVWYSSGVIPIEILEIPNKDVFRSRLPCYEFPSDHLNLMVKFVFE
jgi:mRNA deadenylase 3'-5' endonuclease subunit Ccr4